MEYRRKIKRNILEEILFSLLFGFTTAEDYKIILLRKFSFNSYFYKIVSFLNKNYDKTIKDIENKIKDNSKKELIESLNNLVFFQSDKAFTYQLESYFLCSENQDFEIIKNNINKYISSLQKTIELNDKMIFYLLLIGRLTVKKNLQKEIFKQVFENKFDEKKIELLLLNGEKIAQKFKSSFPCDIENLLPKKQKIESEESELLLLLIFFLCFEEIQTNENTNSVLNKYFKYFLKFDLCQDIYCTFNNLFYQYCQQKSLNKDFYSDFFISFLNNNNHSKFQKNKSTQYIFQTFLNYIIQTKDNLNLNKLNHNKLILFLNPFISSCDTKEDESILINLFHSLVIIPQKYRQLIWKKYKDDFKQMLISKIKNKKVLFALTFFIKYYKIIQKKESFQFINDRLNISNDYNNTMIECMLVLIYSSSIRNKIKPESFISKYFKIIYDKSHDIKYLRTELKEYEKTSFHDQCIMINNHIYLDERKGRMILNQGTYDEKQKKVSLNSLAYINKVEIKITNNETAKQLLDSYKEFKEIDGNLQMLGVVVLNTEYSLFNKKKRHVFLFNKYNNYWYYLNEKEFLLNISVYNTLESVKKIVMYFFLMENIGKQFNKIKNNMNKFDKYKVEFPFDFKDYILWLIDNDIKNSFDFILNYLQNNFNCLDNICKDIIETRKNPKIKSEEESNLLKFAISCHEGKNNQSEWTKKIKDFSEHYKP